MAISDWRLAKRQRLAVCWSGYQPRQKQPRQKIAGRSAVGKSAGRRTAAISE
ncbi:MAG: hypothetical protein RRB12_01545 [Armatimonadota bacterium]|nr:hypothetical protein [Armatimonadota bacterium]